MSKPLIIGLTGLAGSGKTTVAEYLRDEHDFQLLNFADPLKDMVKKLDPIIGVRDETDHISGDLVGGVPVHLSEFLDDDKNFLPAWDEVWVKQEFPEYRRILQTLGTECIRGIDQDFWVKILKERVDQLAHHGASRFVVADVRLWNEALAVQDFVVDGFNTKLVEVKRPGVLPVGAHATEMLAGRLGEQDTIFNTGDLNELYLRTEFMLAVAQR